MTKTKSQTEQTANGRHYVIFTKWNNTVIPPTVLGKDHNASRQKYSTTL